MVSCFVEDFENFSFINILREALANFSNSNTSSERLSDQSEAIIFKIDTISSNIANNFLVSQTSFNLVAQSSVPDIMAKNLIKSKRVFVFENLIEVGDSEVASDVDFKFARVS